MPATRTTATIAAPHTQESLTAAIRTRMNATGFGNPFDEFQADGNEYLIYQVVRDPSKTYGSLFFWVQITPSLEVSQMAFTAWNATTHTGENAGSSTNALTFDPEALINFVGYNAGTEFKLLVGYQASLNFGKIEAFIGFISPLTKPAFWDENISPYIFIATSSFARLREWYTVGNTPYQTPYITSNLTNAEWNGRNPFNNQPDILTKALFFGSNQGLVGITSDDLGQVSELNLSVGDIVTSGTKQYAVLTSNTSAALPVVRIA